MKLQVGNLYERYSEPWGPGVRLFPLFVPAIYLGANKNRYSFHIDFLLNGRKVTVTSDSLEHSSWLREVE